MKTVVQKFGGSSLATAELRGLAATRVLETQARGMAVVVVCSAMGRAPDPYATDSLAALAAQERRPTAANGSHSRARAEAQCRDLLLACGETIACAVFAQELSARGADVLALTGAQAGIVTDAAFGDAAILRIEPTTVRAALECGAVPVVAGFQGATEDGTTTTLGRGGSDLSAIAFGAALGAEVVEIFTDVSGVMSGDPRRIADAHPLPLAHYAELVELASEGAKVMHAKAAELARVSRTPYVIKGLQANFGTTIDESVASGEQAPVTGIAAASGLAFFRVIAQGGPRAGSPDTGHAGTRANVNRAVFRRLAEHVVSIDMVNINDAGVFFIVAGSEYAAARTELDALELKYDVREDCTKLSIVGAGMRGAPGVVSLIVDALGDAEIDILHTTDSNITISLLVSAGDAARAELILHDAFALGRRDARAPETVNG